MLELVLKLVEAVRTLLDQGHLVAHLQERAGDVGADLAASGDDRIHQALASWMCADSFRTALLKAEIAVCVGQIVRMPRAA